MTTMSLEIRTAWWRRSRHVLPWLAAAPSSPRVPVRGQPTQSPVAQGKLGSVAVVTHGSPGDAFWNVVENGAEAVGNDLGVRVEYNSSGDPGQQSSATFDLDTDVVEAIRAGKLLFVVDQQQYEQGYLPNVLLQHELRRVVTP
ncbi:hypothetical protein ACQPXH_09870 [Nocardia sp. CA-135953]|uniref:hypothetical protein n=1 Tax=Nocardia sp. CA-135953 TaxID=3239978 RepID=UPI003D978EE0